MREGDRQVIETLMHSPVTATLPLEGGCTAAVALVTLEDGRTIVFKTSPGNQRALLCEAHGLEEIASVGALKTPEVLHVDAERLVLSYVPTGRPSADFFARFGEGLARLHRRQCNSFGYREDNYIGSTVQINTPQVAYTPGQRSWAEFFYEHRLLVQLRLLEGCNRASPRIRQLFSGIDRRVDELLGPVHEPPTLLHGDLWSGNYLVGEDGEPYLIDPAVYYGCRETDIALTRLFGGFGRDFYRAYESAFPLAAGYAEREILYNLYHLMNHLLLLGGSYEGQVVSNLERLR